jgi:hypothetical protein
MDFRKHAFIIATVGALQDHEGWSGRTQLQKSLFLLKALTDVDVPFQYVLYKHGPYSFDLEEELVQVRSYAAVRVNPIPAYGVTLELDKNADYVRRKAPLNAVELQEIGRICAFAAPKNVTALERIATAVWVRRQEGITEPYAVSQRVHVLKPHVSVEEAAAADAEAMTLLAGLIEAPLCQTKAINPLTNCKLNARNS